MAKYLLPPGTHFDVKMIPTIQNLTALGLTQLDIGIILGYAGKDPSKWITNLKRNHPDVKDAAEQGKKMALAQLVSSMFKAAQGYTYTETRDEDGPKGHVDARYKKHVPPNANLAIFLACNLMSDVFKQKSEVETRSVRFEVSGKAEEDKITKLMGMLGVTTRETGSNAAAKKVESIDVTPERKDIPGGDSERTEP